MRRRPPRRPPILGPAPRPLRMLRHAQQLLAAGRYTEALPILEQLADGADQRGMPIRAAELNLQAAQAHLALGQIDAALARGRQALHTLISAGRIRRVQAILPKITTRLREAGYANEATSLQHEIEAALQNAPSPGPIPVRRGRLPAKCPNCGGPIRADAVHWIDAQSVECVYCGSVVHTEPT